MYTQIHNKITTTIRKLLLPKHHECNFCHSEIQNFLPYQGGWKSQPPLMILLNLTGSDVDNFSCPVCGAHDRERHLRMYLEKLYISVKFKNASILHFAPEKKLSDYIVDQKPAHYIKADLFPVTEDIVKMDMLDIPFPNNFFDFVIANHVLEHVNDFSKAVSEIQRVLKVGGYAILQTPYSTQLHHTIEDEGINNDNLRLHLYGQEDHVRLFGKDIFSLISNHGFRSHTTTHQKVLSEISPVVYGVNPQEPLFLFEKIAND